MSSTSLIGLFALFRTIFFRSLSCIWENSRDVLRFYTLMVWWCGSIDLGDLSGTPLCFEFLNLFRPLTSWGESTCQMVFADHLIWFMHVRGFELMGNRLVRHFLRSTSSLFITNLKKWVIICLFSLLVSIFSTAMVNCVIFCMTDCASAVIYPYCCVGKTSLLEIRKS